MEKLNNHCTYEDENTMENVNTKLKMGVETLDKQVEIDDEHELKCNINKNIISPKIKKITENGLIKKYYKDKLIYKEYNKIIESGIFDETNTYLIKGVRSSDTMIENGTFHQNILKNGSKTKFDDNGNLLISEIGTFIHNKLSNGIIKKYENGIYHKSYYGYDLTIHDFSSCYNFINHNNKIIPVMRLNHRLYQKADLSYGDILNSFLFKSNLLGNLKDIIKNYYNESYYKDLLINPNNINIDPHLWMEIFYKCKYYNIDIPKSLCETLCQKYYGDDTLNFSWYGIEDTYEPIIEFTKKIISSDDKWYPFFLLKGWNKTAELFSHTNNHLLLKRAYYGDIELATLPLDKQLKQQIYIIANIYKKEELVNAMSTLDDSMIETNYFYSPLKSNVDIKYLKKYLELLMNELKPLIKTEMNPDWFNKGNDFGRILGARFLRRLIQDYGIKNVFIPNKYIVIDKSIEFIEFYISKNIRLKTQIQVGAERIRSVDRDCTREEFIDLITILILSGYNDIHTGNFILTEKGFYIIDTEETNFNEVGNLKYIILYLPKEDYKWGKETIKNLLNKIPTIKRELLNNYLIKYPFQLKCV